MNLNNLNDKQTSLITQLAYLDSYTKQIKLDNATNDTNEIEKVINSDNKLKISDLKNFLIKPNSNYLGLASKIVTGIKTTKLDLINEIEKNDLGDLEIVKLIQNEKASLSCIILKDDSDNIGFSFRGTQVNSIKELALDSIYDVMEYITDDSKQIEEAKKLYNNNNNKDGKHFLYGHSLGGNIAQHIFLENSDTVEKAFVVNATPINEELSKSLEEQDFQKIESIVVQGDWVSKLKVRNDNINHRYIKNNKRLHSNVFSSHTVEALEYNKEGNFFETSEEDTKYPIQTKLVKLINGFGMKLKQMYERIKIHKRKNLLPEGREKICKEPSQADLFRKKYKVKQNDMTVKEEEKEHNIQQFKEAENEYDFR